MGTPQSLEEIFEKFTKPRIFKARELLLPDYVPEDLPHREKQILKLGSILAPAIAGSKPSNVFIYGLPGTGKTAARRAFGLRGRRLKRHWAVPRLPGGRGGYGRRGSSRRGPSNGTARGSLWGPTARALGCAPWRAHVRLAGR